MTGQRNTIAKYLVARALLCALALPVCGLFSPRLAIASALGFCVTGLGTCVFAAEYVARLRLERRRRLERQPLSDEEFIAAIGAGEELNPTKVRGIRELAAKRFRRLGGDRFYPDDRFEEDLHLADAAPYASERFWIDLFQRMDVCEAEFGDELAEMKTFGDLVRLTKRYWQAPVDEGVPTG